jgi:hypothetical protein
MKRLSLWIGLFALSIALVSAIGRFIGKEIALSGDIPVEIAVCVEPEVEEIPKPIAAIEREGEKFFLFAYFARDVDRLGEDIRGTSIILLSSDGCVLVFPEILSFQVSYTPFVPEEIAREFALAELRETIRIAGGIEKFKQGLEEIPLDGELTRQFFPEQAWAFEKLGIPLPRPYKIILDRRKVDE